MQNSVEPAQTKASLPGALLTEAVSEEKKSEQDLLIFTLLTLLYLFIVCVKPAQIGKQRQLFVNK